MDTGTKCPTHLCRSASRLWVCSVVLIFCKPYMSNDSFKGTLALVMVLEKGQKREPGKQVMDQIMLYLDPAKKKNSPVKLDLTLLLQCKAPTRWLSTNTDVSKRSGWKIRICIYTHFFMAMYKKDRHVIKWKHAIVKWIMLFNFSSIFLLSLCVFFFYLNNSVPLFVTNGSKLFCERLTTMHLKN